MSDYITYILAERQEEIARQNNILLKRMEHILMNDNRAKLFRGRKKSLEGHSTFKKELSSIEQED